MGKIILEEQAAADTPAANKVALYAKAGGLMYSKDDAGVETAVSGIANVVEDTTPELGGDLDLNGSNIDFPTTANISDCLDEDDMATDSATMLATQQSIKAYTDTQAILWAITFGG